MMLSFGGYILWIPRVGSWISVNLWHELILGLSLLLFAMVFGPRRWFVWRYILLGFGLLAAAMQLLGLLLFSNELAPLAVYGPGAFYGARPLHANSALFMVVALALVLSDRRMDGRWQMLLGMVLGLSAVYSQWRSVWAALAVVLLVWVWRSCADPALRRSLPVSLAVGVSWAVVLLSPVLTGRSLLPGGGVEAVGSVELPDTATSTGTLGWRFEMWRSRLEAPRSVANYFFGGVFTDSNVVFPGKGIMRGSLSGHNLFVDLYTYLGLVGLGLLVVLVWAAFRVGGPASWEHRTLLLAVLVYGMFFLWAPWMWVLLGVPAGLARGTVSPPWDEAPIPRPEASEGNCSAQC
ncbi:MAG: hypothetical protein E6Q90_11415 [Actinobacteria bacterium]|nr:MAG: hypothetical protein E6Q90_11415 [Actinomycetota bacterium]